MIENILDGSCFSGEPPPENEQTSSRSRMRLHRRHIRRALRLLRRRRHPLHRLLTVRQNLHGSARATHRKRSVRAEPRHRLRRVHASHPRSHRRAPYLPSQLSQQPPSRRSKDRGDRDLAAVQLGSPRLGHRPRREPR